MSKSPSLIEQNTKINYEQLSDKTFGNQKKLPVVPLPNLKHSCATFMEWCSPLLTEEEIRQTQISVEKFSEVNGPGEKLHKALISYGRAKGVKSWLDRFWDTRYLGRRDPIALNANFFLMLSHQPMSQIDRAADIIMRAMCYKLELDAESIPPILQKGQPICMNQNKFLFSTTRIPGFKQDTCRTPYSNEAPGPSEARHIIVFHNGHIFTLDTISDTGRSHSFSDLKKGLLDILLQSNIRLDKSECVGHLTTKARANWAGVKKLLLDNNENNRKALETIESALFAVCLEDISPDNDQEVADNLLHGDSGNRWFDKSVQFIIFNDGSSGVNIEHCGLDGTVILNLIDRMADYTLSEIYEKTQAEDQGTPHITPIHFVLNTDLKNEVISAAQNFSKMSQNASTLNFTFEAFGTNRIKELKASPDAFAQLSFQLAHYRTKGFIGATYESIATRQFENGRTEAMRVITPEIIEFVQSFEAKTTKHEKVEAFQLAARKHIERAHLCQSGQAPEQHLWELLNIYKAEGKELGIQTEPSLYKSPGWIKMRDDVMSTSSVPSPNVKFIGFGSTSSQCIGIGYILRPTYINAYLSTPKKYRNQLDTFSKNLEKSFSDLEEILS